MRRFDALVPQLMRVASEAAIRLRCCTAAWPCWRPSVVRSAYLALLVEHPPVLPRIAHLMGASAWAADYLTRHPLLLDELLDGRELLAEPDWTEWRRELNEQLAMHADDAEHQLDTLRHFQHAQTFRLLAQDVNGSLTVERLGDHLSALADIVLAAALTQCWLQIQRSRRRSLRNSPSSGTANSADANSATHPTSTSFFCTTILTRRQRSCTAGSRSVSTTR